MQFLIRNILFAFLAYCAIDSTIIRGVDDRLIRWDVASFVDELELQLSGISYIKLINGLIVKSSGAFVCWHPSSLSIKKTRRTVVLSSAK